MQCVADGEEALERALRDAFPDAVFTNDFMHACGHLHTSCENLGLPAEAAGKEYRFLKGLLYRSGAAAVIKRLEGKYAQALAPPLKPRRSWITSGSASRTCATASSESTASSSLPDMSRPLPGSSSSDDASRRACTGGTKTPSASAPSSRTCALPHESSTKQNRTQT